MKMHYKLGLPLAIAVVAIGLLSYRAATRDVAAQSRHQNVPLVKVARPVRDTVEYTLDFSGDVIAIQQAAIYSKVSGNLEHVYVNMGTLVAGNQLLAQIDTTELAQAYDQANATYVNAKLAEARAKELYEKNLGSKQDFDNADAALKVAQAAYETSATHLQYSRITAPFGGVVTRRYLDAGALVNSNNSTLFDLMDIDSMKVIINILEKDIPRVMKGTKATITVDAYPGREFLGEVTRYSQAVDPGTRTMAVEIDIPNKDHSLKSGMYATVRLLIERRPDALIVPSGVVLKDNAGNYVYVVVADTARQVRVTTGVEEATRTEILTGITDSTRVITTGQQFVRNGGPVAIQS
jgi:RND family efflux transporter MFP subunit